jgi:hypothetical protein
MTASRTPASRGERARERVQSRGIYADGSGPAHWFHLTGQVFPRTKPRTKLLGKAGRIGIFGFEDFPMNPAANHCPLPESAVWCIAVDAVRPPPFPRLPVLPTAFTPKANSWQ